MTSLDWKGSKILPIIKDFASSDGTVHLSDFKIMMWRNDTVQNVKAAGGTWITKLFNKIKVDNNRIPRPRLCNQTKDDDYDSTEFKKRVVAMAEQAGRSFKNSELASNQNLKKSYDSFENDIQSFGAQ
eukprot:2762206-Rhodomonas_salina.1